MWLVPLSLGEFNIPAHLRATIVAKVAKMCDKINAT